MRPFGLPHTPFDPRSGKYLSLGEEDSGRREFTIVEVGNDALLATDREGRPKLLGKPWQLRKSEYDGVTFGAGASLVTFASLTAGTRTATGPNGNDLEFVTPDYLVGEKVIGIKKDERDRVEAVIAESELTGINAGTYFLEWEDINAAGRRWDAEAARALVASIVTEVGGGQYTWALHGGRGPLTGNATEMNGSTGITPGTIVVLISNDGLFEFFFPIEDCP